MVKRKTKSGKALKIFLTLVLLMVLVAGGIFIVKKRKEQLAKIPPPTVLPLPVTVTSVRQGQLEQTRRYTGIVQARVTGLISPRITAQILKIIPFEGDTVNKGQLLVLLDSKTHRARIGALKAQLMAAKSSLNTLHSIYKRDLELFNGKALSKEALDKSRTAYKTAKARVVEIENNLNSARAELSYTRIMAPYDALVIKRLMEPGDTAVVGKPVLELESMDAGYRLIVKLPQPVFSLVTKKTMVQILPPPGLQAPALSSHITALYPAQASQSASMPICEIGLRHRPYGLPPGSSLNVLFHIKKTEGFVIPARALLQQAIGRFLVYTVTQENKIHIVPVRLLLTDEDLVCVSGKLRPGTRVVVAGEDVLIRLHEGDKVHPVETSSKRRL